MSRPLPFLIVGLPRSRTAWLAAFLTEGAVMCHHELLARCHNAQEFCDKLHDPRYEVVGDSDPNIPTYYPFLMPALGPHKVIFVDRDEKEAHAASDRFMANEVGITPPVGAFDAIVARYKAMKDFCVDFMAFSFGDLDDMDKCRQLAEYATEQPFNEDRWQLFNQLRVTVIPQKAYAHVLNKEKH